MMNYCFTGFYPDFRPVEKSGIAIRFRRLFLIFGKDSNRSVKRSRIFYFQRYARFISFQNFCFYMVENKHTVNVRSDIDTRKFHRHERAIQLVPACFAAV